MSRREAQGPVHPPLSTKELWELIKSMGPQGSDEGDDNYTRDDDTGEDEFYGK